MMRPLALPVMAGLDPAIPLGQAPYVLIEITGTSPVMTGDK